MTSMPAESVQDADKSNLYGKVKDVKNCDESTDVPAPGSLAIPKDDLTNLLDPKLEFVSIISKSWSDSFSVPSPSSESRSSSIVLAQDQHDAEGSNTKKKKSEDTKVLGDDVSRKKRIRKPDFCYFCRTDVSNFARHIKRSHISELEVTKIFALKANSKERKDLITCLRKKGNFVKKSKICNKPDYPVENCVPCKHCLGFYSSKQLWRHVRKCTLNKGDSTPTFSHLTDAQNLLLQGMEVDKALAEAVFPRMLADTVSLVAKKDVLICMLGANYLKYHRQKTFIQVCSRKMREMARLLIAMMEAEPSIESMYHALKPQNLDLIVQCTKDLSKFDANKDKSSTYAMNIHYSLKKCCDIVILNGTNGKLMDPTDLSAEDDFKTMRRLLQDSWGFEVQTKVAADQSSEKWNKVSIITLATDLRIFHTYLEMKSNKAYLQLQQNGKNLKAFQTLTEVVFCRLLLLNTRRIEELQNMPLQAYVENNEEFSEVITPTERILLKTFKRVEIRGGPVLFSVDLQRHARKLIELRGNFVNADNIYLFTNLKTRTSIVGHKVLHKYAMSSEANEPTTLTSTKLRKLLAYISQLFSMSADDIEELATFMGHPIDLQQHKPINNLYVTAKMSKLLLLMEKGEAAQYRGRTLEEIDINLEINMDDFNCIDDELRPNEPGPSGTSVTVPKKRILIPWAEQQKEKTKKFFEKHIRNKQPPKRFEIVELKLQTGNLLDNKSWQQVKAFVQNQYNKK